MVEKNDTNESNINQQKEKNDDEIGNENHLFLHENESKEAQPQTSKNGLQVKNCEIPAKLNSTEHCQFTVCFQFSCQTVYFFVKSQH